MSLWELPATELVAGYRSRAFSPREVVDELAERIERVDPALGAFAMLALDRARAEAGAAEAAYARGDAVGPLAGVPFAAKDIFDTAGIRTSYGSRIFAAHVPERDAAAVAALRRAGAVLIGKTRTHEFAWGITTINEAMGSTRNPWDPSRVPGGSSGGSAAALAARLVPLAIGTDTGGSIRLPAAFCGILGLKPTFGRLDIAGAWPLAPSLDHVGAMARTPEDLALLFGALDGVAPPAAGAGRLDGVTVVTCADLHPVPLEPAIGRVYRDALATFERLSARVEERAFPRAELIDDAYRTIQQREAAHVHGQAGLFPARADEYGEDVRARLARGSAIELADYVRECAAREVVRAELGRLLHDGALLATPASAVAPIATGPRPTVDASDPFRAAVLPYTVPQNLAGFPPARCARASTSSACRSRSSSPRRRGARRRCCAP